jgi:predicted nucleic acid-binding Zn ribbon protein
MNEPLDEPLDGLAANLAQKCDRERRRSFARGPKPIGKVLAQLITSRGYGRLQADQDLQHAWAATVGEALAKQSRACRVYRSKLEVLVANSTTRHVLEFDRQRLLEEMRRHLPDARITDLRFRVGAL